MTEYTRGITIDGITYNVPLVSIKRNFDILDKYAERNEEGVLSREVLGVYANFTLTFGILDDELLYKKLVDKLTEPVAFHQFCVPTESGDFKFTGYISQVSDSYEKILEDSVTFQELTCKFTAKAPYRTP